MPTLTPQQLEELDINFNEAKSFRWSRDAGLDVVFTGWYVAGGTLGDAARKEDWTRWTGVDLAITTGGRYIVSVQRGTKDTTHSSDAAVFDSFPECIRWLADGNKGRIGPASKSMITEAAERLSWLAGADAEPADEPLLSL